MEMFAQHKMIRDHNSYTVILHLERQPGEFSDELLLSIDSKRKTLQKSLESFLPK